MKGLTTMYINQISPYTFYAKPPRKLVPISEYKGIILELTQQDKEDIDKIKTEIAKLTLDLSKLEGILAKTYDNSRFYYLDQIGDIEYEIEQKKDKIKQIKQNRLNIQKMIAERTKKKS